MRVDGEAPLVSQNARQQANNCVRHDEGRQLASRQDVVTERKAMAHPLGTHALVDSFVVAAQEHDPFFACQRGGGRLGEHCASRVWQYHGNAWHPWTSEKEA